ncbi:MAG: hypothetical protein JOZ75_10865 [Candidatus Dormibacteraeota bacterium]|nr:hypothetical protein [Candidatus Dormibacteraeota bacterium]
MAQITETDSTVRRGGTGGTPGAEPAADVAAAQVAAQRRRMTVLAYVLPLFGYLLVGFAFTFRAWADPSHSWTGPIGDNFLFMNWMPWIPHALSQGHNPLFEPVLDYPRGVNLAWNTPMPLGSIIAWPITAAAGPVVAYNAMAVLAITLDGFCTYIWLRRHVRPVAAFAAGLLIAMGPWVPQHITQISHISIWPIPLMFLCTERLLAARGPRAVLWGALLGLAGAAQIYLASELLALAVIAIAVALVILALLRASSWREWLPGAAAGLSTAAVIVAIAAAPLLLYQAHGPWPITGPIQPPNTYVADLQNLVIPAGATWLWPHGATASLTALWTGAAEATAYLGAPLILVAVYAAIRWRREPLVLAAALGTAAMVLLSLGPHLHIGGVDTGIKLPAAIFNHLPVLSNLLPVRFSLMADFGLALLLALVLDRTLLRHPWRAKLGSALGVLGVASCLSVVLLATSSVEIPQYFAPGGAASSLPPGTVALVGPYIDDGAASPVSQLWQAESDFHFSLIDGLVITSDAQGHATWILDNPIRDVFHMIQVNGATPPEGPDLRTSLLAELHQRSVTVAILGPMPHRDVANEFLTWLLGAAPKNTQGVLVWTSIPTS